MTLKDPLYQFLHKHGYMGLHASVCVNLSQKLTLVLITNIQNIPNILPTFCCYRQSKNSYTKSSNTAHTHMHIIKVNKEKATLAHTYISELIKVPSTKKIAGEYKLLCKVLQNTRCLAYHPGDILINNAQMN